MYQCWTVYPTFYQPFLVNFGMVLFSSLPHKPMLIPGTGFFHGYDNAVVNDVFTMPSFREMMGWPEVRVCGSPVS